MGRSLWFGAVSSQRAFAGVVVSVRDEGTPSLPPFAPNSILALEYELFVASPLTPNFAGTGVMEESVAATVAALHRCDDGCGVAQRGLCPPCFQYVGCGLFPLGSDLRLVAAPDFALLVSFVGLSHVTDFLGSVVFAGLLEWGAGLFISCRVKGTKENAKVQESCLKAVFHISPQVIREGAAACIAFTGFLPAAAACRMSAAAFLGLASIVEGIRAAAASEGTLTFSWVLVFLSVGAFLILVEWFLAFCCWFLAFCGHVLGLRIKNVWCVSLTHHSRHGVPACVFPQPVEDGAELSLGTAAAACLVAQTAGACAFDVSASLVNLCVHEDEVDREDRPNTAGCLSAGTGDWASGRVDVPGSVHLDMPHESQPQSAASTVAPESSSAPFRFQAMVISLGGQTLMLDVSLETLVLSLVDDVAELLGPPASCFYLSLGSRVAEGAGSDSVIRACARLRGSMQPDNGGFSVGGFGGGGDFGQWTCTNPQCRANRCWPTWSKCFRCGAPKWYGLTQDPGRPPQGWQQRNSILPVPVLKVLKDLKDLKDLKAADLSAACSARHETELLGHFCSEASLAHRGEGVDPKPLRSRVRAAENVFNGAIPRARAVGSGLPIIHGHESVAGTAPRVFGAEARVSSENRHSRTQVGCCLNSRIHESQSSSLACARALSACLLGARGVGAVFAAPCVAALPAGRSLTCAQVAANACGGVASVSNSGRSDTVNSLRVQRSTSYNLTGVVAPYSRRKVRQGCTIGSRYAEQTVDMSPAPAAGTYRRSAGTVHAQRQVPRKRLAKSSGVGAGPGPGLGGRSGYETAWATPGHVCSCPNSYGRGAVLPQANPFVLTEAVNLWSRVASLLTPWCAKGEVPTGVNLNRYSGNGSRIPWHCDNEGLFGSPFEPKVLVSMSLGISAMFKLRRRAPENTHSQIRLDHGDLLVMDGLTQLQYEHSTASELLGPRVNLTFRWIS